MIRDYDEFNFFLQDIYNFYNFNIYLVRMPCLNILQRALETNTFIYLENVFKFITQYSKFPHYKHLQKLLICIFDSKSYMCLYEIIYLMSTYMYRYSNNEGFIKKLLENEHISDVLKNKIKVDILNLNTFSKETLNKLLKVEFLDEDLKDDILNYKKYTNEIYINYLYIFDVVLMYAATQFMNLKHFKGNLFLEENPEYSINIDAFKSNIYNCIKLNKKLIKLEREVLSDIDRNFLLLLKYLYIKDDSSLLFDIYIYLSRINIEYILDNEPDINNLYLKYN
jgi:hypothetical protein